MHIESSLHLPRDPSPQRVGSPPPAAVAPGAIRSLTDIAEEITLGFSQRSDPRRLTDRRPEPAKAFPALTHVELVAFLADTHEGEIHAKLLALTEYLSALTERSAEDITTYIESAFVTPAQHYAALMYARDHAALRSGSQHTYENVTALCSRYEREHADRLNADFHALPYARAYATEIGAPASDQVAACNALVGAYREASAGTETLADVLEIITRQLQTGTLSQGLAQLTQAAGEALRQLGHDRRDDVPRTASLVQDLSRLAIVAAAMDGCLDLRQSLAPLGVERFDADGYLQGLVRIILHEAPSAARFSDLARLHCGPALQASIALLHNAKSICRALPIQLHAEPQIRDKLSDAAQLAIDEAVAAEDAL